MAELFDSRYDHTKTEKEIYALWEKSGYFNPDNLPVKKSPKGPSPRALGAKPYTLIMPLPNANGRLHAGHALFITLQDMITRYRRMKGYKALWVPGADHAGFETQIVYEKKLEKEGRSRFGMSRNELYEEILAFTLENKKHMENDLRSIGASCDWSREKFTLDPDVQIEVKKTFEKMYREKLIYRGNRPVNWCTKHQTSLSDLETESKEITDTLYYLRYGALIVATVRPETIFGDVAVAVNPKDRRYKKLIGTTIEVKIPEMTLSLKVIGDESVDIKFGTGALKITPAHDAHDFEIGQKHGLPLVEVIDKFGKLNDRTGKYAKMKIKDARAAVVSDLKAMNLIEKTEPYTHAVPVCYKCETTIEPRVMKQWFVKMKPLAAMAAKAVRAGKIKFIPERFKKIFLYWMDHTIDWNISRQIVWGIRIPAWFCLKCGEVKVSARVKSHWFLVRHGETDWNKEQRMQGQVDIPLNDTGITQAKVMAQMLAHQNIDLVISSDLSRARQTAEEIAKTTGAELITDKAFRERSYGNAEGTPIADIIKKYPRSKGYIDSFEGGESYAEVEARAWEAFLNHRKNHHPKNVVIVTHGALIRMLKKRIHNLSMDAAAFLPGIKNAEVIQLDIADPCKKCGGDLYEQDPDVFDTWFSSGQWPLLALGWKATSDKRQATKQGGDFKKFYPTQVMETGHDLIFKWVPRMVIFGLYLTKKVPFTKVYLHGLVLDPHGKKMSKSKGNVVGPLELTEKYGTDALRMALVVGNPPGADLALSEDKIRGYRNFATKIWNAARFIAMHSPSPLAASAKEPGKHPRHTIQTRNSHIPLSAADKKNLAELKKIKEKVTEYIEKFQFHLAAETLYHYFWHTFADKVIEEAKPRLEHGFPPDAVAAYATLETILLESLAMLHPFMPFITETLYQKFRPEEMLIIRTW